MWPVTVDVLQLATLPPSVTINFPDHAAVTLVRARTQSCGANAYMWSGRGADCSAVFTVQDGGIAAALSCLNASYSIESGSAGSQQLTRYDPSKLPGEYSNSTVYVDWFRTGVLDQQENYRVITDFAPATAQYLLSLGRLFTDDFEL